MILVAGSANLDFVVRAPHIPGPGETVLGNSYHQYPGGKGANQAVACARAGGLPTAFVGAFGDDNLAPPILASLHAAQVKVHAIRCQNAATGTAFICVSDDGENAITVVPGANAALEAQHLPSLDDVGCLLLQLETPLPTLLAFAHRARQRGVLVVLNAAPALLAARELLPVIDVLVVNEGELAMMSQKPGSIADQMQALAVPTVVTTLGARGCIARTEQGFVAQPSFPVAVIDTTAAGDTFCGALVAELVRSSSMQQALATAAAAGALACTAVGAQTSIPHRNDVLALRDRSPATDPQQVQALRQYCGL